MLRRPPRSTRTDTLFPSTTLFRSPVFSASLAALVLGDFTRVATTPDGKPVKALSAREREVLRLVARGSTYRAVGEELFIAERTVENHVRNILEKLRLNRRDELIRWAAKRGMDE